MGYGYISFTPMQTKVYKFQTSKPWKEIKDKAVLWKTETEYAVLEKDESIPFFEHETGRKTLYEVLERFNRQNQDKEPWNPWRWNCMYFSESDDILTEDNVKKLYEMWDDLWEYIDDAEKIEKEIRKEEKRQQKQKEKWEKERLRDLDEGIGYSFFSDIQKVESQESESEEETASEVTEDEEGEYHGLYNLDRIIYKEAKDILKYAVDNNYSIYIKTICD
jgi:hypothetical protein